MRPVMIRGLRGLGDNIYQRAFVRNRHGSYLDTPWPELYTDLPIRCTRAATTLRTQRANVERSTYAWARAPAGLQELRISYVAEMAHGSIVSAMAKQIGGPPAFDLPPLPASPGPLGKYAVVRPATVRAEWPNSARNPDPAYLCEAATLLRARGYTVVSVADLVDGQEWLVGHAPPADITLHRGELPVLGLLALVAAAAVVVGGVGWLLPAAVAARTPAYLILGGQGGHNAPQRTTGAGMDLTRIGWATPDRYCLCTQMAHECAKTITGFGAGFGRWLDDQRL